jgi:hypothetical protein
VTFVEAMAGSPLLYPIGLDPSGEFVQLVRMTAADYAAASFLDGRALRSGSPVARMPWPDVRAAAAHLPLRCHFIFHISHVGSTLLSRLVGQNPSLFSLREPAVFRQLAEAYSEIGHGHHPWNRSEFDERSRAFLALWSRTFDPAQTAVIKATSFVSEMSEYLMNRVTNARSVFMYVSPLTFLRALLGGAMGDVTGMIEKRLRRLERRLGHSVGLPSGLSPGEAVAMSWLCEMAALQAAADRFPARVLWMDFDEFLAAPASWLAAALHHFGTPDAGEAAATILASPTMGQYAKAPAVAFDAANRRQLLEQADRQWEAEIRKGAAWLQRAQEIPAVRCILEKNAARETIGPPPDHTKS